MLAYDDEEDGRRVVTGSSDAAIHQYLLRRLHILRASQMKHS